MAFFDIYFGYVVISAFLDIAANLAIVKSKGFTKPAWGMLALVCVWIAFILLAQAIKGMDLAVAYSLWGAMGIFGTAVLGRIIFKQKLKLRAWVGMALIIIAIFLLKTAD